jgi:hypothetical protein
MNLNLLTDQSLHQQLKSFVHQERTLVTKVLEHLQEVERRRLYCDFKRTSLFDYAVKELGYSEDQAHRRIQAMRLMKTLPEVKEKLSSGSKLKEKRFGKRRIHQTHASQASQVASESSSSPPLAAPKVIGSSKRLNQRYVPAAMKHAVWQRDHGQCCKCGSRQNLQYDHIHPIGLGGKTRAENLRLLCFPCNQRAAMGVYGVDSMVAAATKALLVQEAELKN